MQSHKHKAPDYSSNQIKNTLRHENSENRQLSNNVFGNENVWFFRVEKYSLPEVINVK